MHSHYSGRRTVPFSCAYEQPHRDKLGAGKSPLPDVSVIQLDRSLDTYVIFDDGNYFLGHLRIYLPTVPLLPRDPGIFVNPPDKRVQENVNLLQMSSRPTPTPVVRIQSNRAQVLRLIINKHDRTVYTF